MQTIVGLVAAGAGIAILPETATGFRTGEVRYRPITEPVSPVPLFAVWHAGNQLPTLHRFVNQWPTG